MGEPGLHLAVDNGGSRACETDCVECEPGRGVGDESMSTVGSGALAVVQPLFVCLGVPKAATTWIHRQLEAHPDVASTLSKEINYWSANYEEGPDWYVNHFPRDRDYEVYAEVSVGYLRGPVIDRLASDVPEARFMVSLRDPHERSWSSYWQSVRNGVFRGSLDRAIHALPKIIDDSLYSPGLTAFLDRFSLDRLHVALYDDLAVDPRSFISDIFTFAGVDSSFVPPDLEQRVNVGRQHGMVDEAMVRTQTLVKKMGLTRGHLVKLGLWSPVERAYARLAKSRPIPPLDAADWDLLDEHLRSEVRRLESLLDRDLGVWLVRP